MSALIPGFNPQAYVSTVQAPFTLGQTYTDTSNGMLYRYLKNGTDGSIPAGAAVVLTSAIAGTPPAGAGPTYIVTYSKGASQLGSGACAGMCCYGGVPVSNYFFAMIDGEYVSALNAANTAFGVGTPISSGNVANGNWISGAGGNTVVAGYSQANAAGGVFPMRVRI